MPSSITDPDQQIQDHKGHLDALRTHLDVRLAEYVNVSSKASFQRAAHSFPDAANECLVLLARNNVNTHQHLWLSTVGYLSAAALSLVNFYRELDASFDPQVATSMNHMLPTVHQVDTFLDKFYRQWDMAVLGHGTLESRATVRFIFANLVLDSMDLYRSGWGLVNGELYLKSAVHCISQYCNQMGVMTEKTSVKLSQLRFELMPGLVSMAKTALLCGVPDAVVPLLGGKSPILDELYVPAVLADESPELGDIIDFYRFFGYCLVSAAVRRPLINDELCNLADVFLKVLFVMPNLQTSNYVADLVSASSPLETTLLANWRQEFYFSQVEREELSFYFLINYLLRMHSLTDLVCPDKHFTREISFFIASFNRRVSADLDVLASAAISTTSSAVSLTKIEQRSTAEADSLTLSTILTQGTYKERLRLVLEFFTLLGSMGNSRSKGGGIVKLVQSFSFANAQPEPLHSRGGYSDLCYIVQRIDLQKYPGKALYVEAIDKIVKLCELLCVKHLHSSADLSCSADRTLASLLNSKHSLDSVARVKSSIQFEDGRVKHDLSFLKSEDEAIASQFALMERTRTLDDYIQRLI